MPIDDFGEHGFSWRVMADPEGNEFCLIFTQPRRPFSGFVEPANDAARFDNAAPPEDVASDTLTRFGVHFTGH